MQQNATRNLLVVFFFTIISCTAVFSQTCVIDTNNYALFSPPSETLPCVIRNFSCDIMLQLFCPPTLGGIGIDSIRVTSFPGMPTGLVKTSNPASGTMYPFDRMCIHISGTTTDTVGYYEILYNGTAYTSAGNAPFSYLRANVPGSLPDYALNVINPGDACTNTDTVATGIKSLNTARTTFSVFPNPTTGLFTFSLNAEQKLNGGITIMDVTGRIIYTQVTQAAPIFQTEIDLSRFAKGIYFVQYRTTERTASKKISKE